MTIIFSNRGIFEAKKPGKMTSIRNPCLFMSKPLQFPKINIRLQDLVPFSASSTTQSSDFSLKLNTGNKLRKIEGIWVLASNLRNSGYELTATQKAVEQFLQANGFRKSKPGIRCD